MKIKTLYESKIAASKVQAAMASMISYLERKLGQKLIRVPSVEHFKNTENHGYGIRFFFDGTIKGVRFNWTTEASAGKVAEIVSIDYFSGRDRNPTFSIQTKGLSLVKALPALVTVLKSPSLGKMTVFPVDEKEAVMEQALTEARRDEFSAEQAVTDFLKKLSAGKTFTRSEFIGTYHGVHAGIFDAVLKDLKDKFQIEARRVAIKPGIPIESLKDSIMAKAGIIEIKQGGKDEVYLKTQEEEALEDRPAEQKVSFMDTLEHLEGLVTGIINGAFNALFVSGKGGTGKTQTVERVLSSHGLSDGNGYFKNTGTASASGVYTLLYHHRNDIILFDDSDGALADQDARNLIKAATDTKKERKLVWNKKSSFIFDPESEDAEQYEDDTSMAPKYFNFKGRIIFISNLSIDKLDPDEALRTRAFIINVNPTDQEMFDYMEKILHDIKLDGDIQLTKSQREEVFEVVKTSKRTAGVSLRKLVRALNLAASGASNWKKLVELYS